jgi:hypothetical protein
MTVTVSFVSFDSAAISSIAESIAAALSIELPIHVEVDETTPLARLRVEVGDTVLIHVESGALEDLRRPRQLSERATATALGRALMRVHDRLAGGFGEAPEDDDLSMAQVAAWETYCVARLQRLGIPQNEQRWRYNFRNRHGFHDAADEAFAHLWNSDGLGWGELNEISTRACLSAPTAA